MFKLLKQLFTRPAAPAVQNKLYAEILHQACILAPQRFAAPSTSKEQRYAKFEAIALVMSALMWQARNDPDHKNRATGAMETMFDDFDVNMREQGVSDIRIGPEVRKLAAAFAGRQQRYFDAFSSTKATDLEQAIAHNWKVTPSEAKALAKKVKNLEFF